MAPMRLRERFGREVRDARVALDVSQREVATAVGVSRGYIAHLENGRANPSLRVIERVGDALGITFELIARAPTAEIGPKQRDAVHAWCSGYVDRRLRRGGWQVQREVEIVQGRHHGWVDLVACHPRSSTMLVVEIKTRLDDIGAVERQLSWYERSAPSVARRFRWRATDVVAWLLVLATDEVEGALRVNRDVLAAGFPVRAREMAACFAGASSSGSGRGLALIDPTSKRAAWLMPARIDGRRSPAAFATYSEAARRLTR